MSRVAVKIILNNIYNKSILKPINLYLEYNMKYVVNHHYYTDTGQKTLF